MIAFTAWLMPFPVSLLTNFTCKRNNIVSSETVEAQIKLSWVYIRYTAYASSRYSVCSKISDPLDVFCTLREAQFSKQGNGQI